VPVAYIHDLATERFLQAGESVVLHGLVGIGKTMIDGVGSLCVVLPSVHWRPDASSCRS
jgi:hypothetical protein